MKQLFYLFMVMFIGIVQLEAQKNEVNFIAPVTIQAIAQKLECGLKDPIGQLICFELVDKNNQALLKKIKGSYFAKIVDNIAGHMSSKESLEAVKRNPGGCMGEFLDYVFSSTGPLEIIAVKKDQQYLGTIMIDFVHQRGIQLTIFLYNVDEVLESQLAHFLRLTLRAFRDITIDKTHV